ncbi:rhodanese-like domain-containing protein [Microbacterium sp. BK668]|uniref:rhodanese-like domain-containing protein n=1 Tax=Microbacterium sp. BK668 TaxID=2512118 RepID=UPI0010614901|nr:rhodanese-like domain-containing protein [Microbacterium sp. BK668]TDN93162.1 rhodanese-related sulfurtransferase [Microbacterium sp. BK668]
MSEAIDFFSAKLRLETDASDVYEAQKAGERLVLVDVRGDEAWTQGRISGAIHMPYRQIAERAPDELSRNVPIVVYCWSPGCNAATKGALEFAKLGYSVREMMGGYEYWVREGQPTENDDGPLPRVFDAQVMVIRERVRS